MTEQRGRRYAEPPLRDPETGEIDGKEVAHRAKGWVAVLVAVAVLAGGLWYGGTTAWNAWMTFRTASDYVGEGVDDVEIAIPRGATIAEVSQILVDAGVVKDADAFARYAATRPSEVETLQAGRYMMKTQLPNSAAFDRLMDPANIVRVMMQLPEGQRLSQQLPRMAEASSLPVEQFQDAVTNTPDQLGLPDWAGNRPEGFFYPDTYELPDQPTAIDVIKLTTTQFNKVAGELDFANRAASSPAGDPYRALVVASLIEREVFRDEDRAKVARVIYNRLEKGMPLQFDSTVAYAVDRSGGGAFTTAEERAVDSPYNTYKNSGLPPGPIAAPSRASMEAAVAPEEGAWLYFVSTNLETGETAFSDTLEQHNAAVARLQEWCQASDANRARCSG